jgi:hypothetical protein
MFGRSRSAELTIAPVEVPPARPYRHKLRSLAYVSLDSGGAAVLRDLSQSGLAMQTVTALSAGSHVELRVDLSNPRCRVDAVGRVVWTDSTAQAGVEFVSISAKSQQTLSEWILAQLLTDASRIAGDGELLFSTTTRPAIRVEPRVARDWLGERDLCSLRMLGMAVSAQRFARVVDGLVLFCAVMMFSLISLFLIDILPVWWFTLLFLCSATAVFAGLYWFVFDVWFGTTPGNRLALLAGSSVSEEKVAQPTPATRFR